MSDHVIAVQDENFEQQVLKADKSVILDFWAEWCAPCKMLAPIFSELATEYSDRAIFAKMDISENKETPAKFGVRGIPTLLIFKDGEVQATKIGAVTKSELIAFIDSNL